MSYQSSSLISFALPFLDAVSSQNCCEKLSIPQKCHFLCGTHQVSWWSLTRWTCTHSHGASVAKCKVNAAVDYVKLFGTHFTNTVQDGFNQLSSSLKAKLSDAKEFVKVTRSELRGIKQDVLASLSTVSEMTPTQFFGLLMDRLTSFTTANLRDLLSKVKIDVIKQNILDIKNRAWDLSQLNVVMDAVYKAYGTRVSDWVGATIVKFGNLLSALPSSKFAQFSATAFDASVTELCKVKLDVYQKMNLIIPATKSMGTMSTWTSAKITKLCNLVEALTPEELLELSAKEISGAVDKLKSFSFTEEQLDVILKKLKGHLGEISSWSQSQLENVGKMIKGLKSTDLAKIDKDKIKNMITSLGNIKWDPAQSRQLATKLLASLGLPETWTSVNINQAKTMLQGLVASQLDKLKNSELAASIRGLKNVKWSVDQAQVVFENIKKQLSLNSLTKDDVLALANTMDTWASSDVGRFTQSVLFAAFPELLVAKTIATPVLRQFIQVYKNQPSNTDIGLLGGIAQALTRMELNQATIADIVVTLEQLTGNDWDEAQIAELMVKVRAKLGALNLTETADVDSPPWGSKNLLKLGKVILGFTKEELKSFPIRGIEDSLEVLGKQSGWKRGQIVFVMGRFKEYLKMRNVTIQQLSDVEIKALGSLVQGFALKELKSLPNSLLTTAVQKIGEQTGLPEDKIKSISFAAVENFKKVSGVDTLDVQQVKSLGNLITGLHKQALLTKLSKNAFLSEAYNIAKRPGMSKDKLQALIDVGKKHYGQSDTGKWFSEQWKRLGPALKAMRIEDIRKINKDSFEDLIDYFGQMDGWSVEQAQALVLKAKEYWNENDVSKWSGSQLRRLGSLIQGVNIAEIKRIATTSFKDMIGSCAHFTTINKETLQALATRAKEVLASNDAAKFDFKAIKLIGCAVTGLSTADLAKMNFNIDVIAELGKHTGWNVDQLREITKKVKEFLKSNVNKENLMSIGSLIKGFTADDIKAFSKDAFSYAAGKLGKVAGLSVDQIKALANKAKETYGNDVSQWSMAQISEAGNMIGGLSTADIPKINTNAIDRISVKTLKLMTKNQIKAFTPSQLTSMDSTQAYSLSVEQKSQLSSAQVEALASVERSDPKDPDPWDKVYSGASRIEMSNLVFALLLFLSFLVWNRD
eukprot:gene18072-19881_t